MIELAIKEHMERLLDAPVFFEFPQDQTQRFVVLKIENNPRENLLDSAMLVADSYGGSQLEAAGLNTIVKMVLDSLIELPRISASHRGGDYPAFDTQNKRYRYQAVQNITYYEE